MKLENQVTSLDLSKRLKELGVKQESLFWHCQWLESGENVIKYAPDSFSQVCPIVSAFTASEIHAILGEEVTIPKDIENISNYYAIRLIDKLSAPSKKSQKNTV